MVGLLLSILLLQQERDRTHRPPKCSQGRRKMDALRWKKCKPRLRPRRILPLLEAARLVFNSLPISNFLWNKRVVLIHSRSELLPSFRKRLHEYVISNLAELGVKIILEERPQLPSVAETMSLQFKDMEASISTLF